MTQRRQYLVFFGLVVAVIAAAFVLGRPRGAPRLLDSVPRDAWLVATVDVAALRGSALAKPILGAGDKAPIAGLGGLGGLAEKCGFDPVTRVREIVVTSPENGERGDFGVAFTGDFTMAELAKCADSVIRSRGGTPATSARGGFTLVEDTGDPKHARLAYREGGPYLVGSGPWLDAMIDATLGKGERARPEHAQLREAVVGKQGAGAGEGAGSPPKAVVLTALLPSTVRDRLKAELGPEASGPGEKSFAGVLGVSAVGLAAGTGGPGSTTDLTVELQCESASACDEVDKLIERKRLSFSRDLGVRLVGLGPLLDSLAVHSQGVTLRATASAPTDDLARAIQRVLDFRSRLGGPVGGAGEPSPSPPEPPASNQRDRIDSPASKY